MLQVLIVLFVAVIAGVIGGIGLAFAILGLITFDIGKKPKRLEKEVEA